MECRSGGRRMEMVEDGRWKRGMACGLGFEVVRRVTGQLGAIRRLWAERTRGVSRKVLLKGRCR